MLNPAWLDAMAEAFWGAAGGAPPAFPRDLEPAILYATPLAVVSLPRLRPRAIDAWLARHGAAPVLDARGGRPAGPRGRARAIRGAPRRGGAHAGGGLRPARRGRRGVRRAPAAPPRRRALVR